ncbi:MAG: ArnT family glycosyltransferase [Sphingomonas sp.]
MRRISPPAVWAFVGLIAALIVLAFVRPLDHDESQYVAATLLAQHHRIYADFAYLQTPLQPLLFAPLVGNWALVELRLINALLGAATAGFVYAGCRTAGADRRPALLAAILFACCDAFLFASTVARNDMLPACMLAAMLWLSVRQCGDRSSAVRAVTIGFLLSAATAAKLSYAMPALAYGALALIDRRHRPGWLILGAVPPALLVAATWAGAPAAFAFDVLRFPTAAPEQFYATHGAFKLSLLGRILDTLKFLALGPALLAALLVARDRQRDRIATLLAVMTLAGLIAAILPAPTWRQYLLVMLVPLFVRLSIVPAIASPAKALRIAAAIFVAAGVAPSLVALAMAISSGPPLVTAIEDGRALEATMDRLGVTGPIATLSPQLVAATGRPIDPRFAAGPFFFRSTGLLSPGDERRFALLGHASAAAQIAEHPPAAILVGGEGAWTSGDPHLDGAMAMIARQRGWRGIAVTGTPLTLYLPDPR